MIKAITALLTFMVLTQIASCVVIEFATFSKDTDVFCGSEICGPYVGPSYAQCNEYCIEYLNRYKAAEVQSLQTARDFNRPRDTDSADEAAERVKRLNASIKTITDRTKSFVAGTIFWVYTQMNVDDDK